MWSGAQPPLHLIPLERGELETSVSCWLAVVHPTAYRWSPSVNSSLRKVPPVSIFSNMAVVNHEGMPTRIAIGPSVESDLGGQAPVLVECFTLEAGRAFVDHRLTRSAMGEALHYSRQSQKQAAGWSEWKIEQVDEASGLRAEVTISQPADLPALRFQTTVHNDGLGSVHLTAVSMAAATLLPGSNLQDIDLYCGRNSWQSEGRWSRRRITEQEGLVEIDSKTGGSFARHCIGMSAESGWSSGHWSPVGFVEDRRSGHAVGWQVEHNGAWTVELSQREHCLGIAAYGPTDLQHHWLLMLPPGESFTTPTITFVTSEDGWQGTAAELTRYRRALRARRVPQVTPAPIVFNDYMNTLMADPTTEKLLRLIPAAAGAGAEVFCIDAGWHADETDWWDGVGLWQPSTTRFPGGIAEVLRAISNHGMTPGLWIEPLAVGTRSPLASQLPHDALMRRRGVAIVEQNRYRLDLRSPAAREHLDNVVDRLLSYGIGYLKLDDNYSIGSGPDWSADSPGEGLRAHCEAYANWLADLRERHPELTVENCASGGMTTDYAMLRSADLQSTSDMQDWLRYPPIAASAPLTVLPEQAANWAYPQPEMDPETVVFTLTTSLAGSFYFSGHLDRLQQGASGLVREAITFARAGRERLAELRPAWPVGLPQWDAPWTVLALNPEMEDADQSGLLLVWHRPRQSGSSTSLELDLGYLGRRIGHVEQVFPATRWEELATWHIETSSQGLRIAAAEVPTARVLKVVYEPS